MILTDKLTLSRNPYAVKVDGFEQEATPSGQVTRSTVPAVWFRRRRGVTVASAGVLWGYGHPVGATLTEFLTDWDNRYGGECVARWDGRMFWGPSVTLDEQPEFLAVLKPMLAGYPAIPDGWQGWWQLPPRDSGGSTR